MIAVTRAVLRLICLLLAIHPASYAWTPLPPVPYSLETSDGNYVLVMLPERCDYCREDKRWIKLFETYPSSGVYARGSEIPLWEIEEYWYNSHVLAFVEIDGAVYLARETWEKKPLIFYEKNRVIAEYDFAQLVERQWALHPMLGPPHWRAKHAVDNQRHVMNLETIDANHFTFDLKTGEMLDSSLRDVGTAEEPRQDEHRLLTRVEEFVRQLTRPASQSAILDFFPERVLRGCEHLAYQNEVELGLDGWLVEIGTPTVQGLDIVQPESRKRALGRATRLEHTGADRFDVYRLLPGEGLRFQCGTRSPPELPASLPAARPYAVFFVIEFAGARIQEAIAEGLLDPSWRFREKFRRGVVSIWVKDQDWRIAAWTGWRGLEPPYPGEWIPR